MPKSNIWEFWILPGFKSNTDTLFCVDMAIKKGKLGHLCQKNVALQGNFSVLFYISAYFPKRPSKGLFHDLHIEFLLALTGYAYAKGM